MSEIGQQIATTYFLYSGTIQIQRLQTLPVYLWLPVILVLTIALSPSPALAQQTESGQIYVVQLDDTLWKIAEKYLGDGRRYPEIVVATTARRTEDSSLALVTDPNLILPGFKLWIPATPLVTPTSPASSPTPTQIFSSPQVSVDQPGGHIAFSFWNNAPNRCTYEINIIDVAACLQGPESCQANRRIFSLNNAGEPALSPDGQRLAFRGWGDLPEENRGQPHPYVNCAKPRAQRGLGHTDLTGTDYHPLVSFWEDSHPDWSPDGNRLLFDTARHGDGVVRIMTVTADDRREEDLRLAGQQPSWAPDNERFVYRGCDLSGNRCGLWLAQALPVPAWEVGHNIIGPVVEEAAAAHPDWSPVNDMIVYQSPVGGSWDLYLIKADGSHRQQLTVEAGVEGLPVWSPDGQWIAYLSDRGGQWGIWLMGVDGSDERLLFAFDGGLFSPLPVAPYYQRDWLDEQLSWSR